MRFGCAIALASCLAACGSPPDGVEPFEWNVALHDLDAAMRAVCADGDELVAVGGRDGATILEWNGSAWESAPAPSGAGRLWWCWIDASGEGFAVGEHGTILHRTGSLTWEAVDTGGVVPDNVTLYGVWGANAGDVTIVGGGFNPDETHTLAAHFDGQQWARLETAAFPDEVLFKVWGAAADDVWIVGTGGTILHFDGDSWTPQTSSTAQRLISVWGTGGDDVFAVGGDAAGIVLRYDGARWSTFATPQARLSGVWTAPGRPLYVAGDRGYMARYSRADPTSVDEVITLPNVDMHSLIGLGDAVVGCGADLLGGGDPSWAGAVVVHGGDLTGNLSLPDAGIDAALPDAASTEPDASPYPGPGEICGVPPNLCAPGLTCWGFLTSDVYVCTKTCSTSSECFEYGPGACCAVPGFQTLETVCIPAEYVECSG